MVTLIDQIIDLPPEAVSGPSPPTGVEVDAVNPKFGVLLGNMLAGQAPVGDGHLEPGESGMEKPPPEKQVFSSDRLGISEPALGPRTGFETLASAAVTVRSYHGRAAASWTGRSVTSTTPAQTDTARPLPELTANVWSIQEMTIPITPGMNAQPDSAGFEAVSAENFPTARLSGLRTPEPVQQAEAQPFRGASTNEVPAAHTARRSEAAYETRLLRVTADDQTLVPKPIPVAAAGSNGPSTTDSGVSRVVGRLLGPGQVSSWDWARVEDYLLRLHATEIESLPASESRGASSFSAANGSIRPLRDVATHGRRLTGLLQRAARGGQDTPTPSVRRIPPSVTDDIDANSDQGADSDSGSHGGEGRKSVGSAVPSVVGAPVSAAAARQPGLQPRIACPGEFDAPRLVSAEPGSDAMLFLGARSAGVSGRSAADVNLPGPQLDSPPARFTLPDQILTTLRPHGPAVQLRIEPEHLGPARLSLVMHDGKLRARVIVKDMVAKVIVESSLDRLTEQLTRANIEVDRIEVRIGGDPAHDDAGRRHPLWDQRQSCRPRYGDNDCQAHSRLSTPDGSAPNPVSYISASEVNLLA